MHRPRQPVYSIQALTTPPDWNPTGHYETKTATPEDTDSAVEWRCHRSAAHLTDATAAAKIINFLNHLQSQYPSGHRPDDYWAAYDVSPNAANPQKLIIQLSAGDRMPTLYILPADPRRPSAPLSLPQEYDPVTHRA